MATIQVIKRYKLEDLGEEWKEAYLGFYALTIGDIEKHKDSIFSPANPNSQASSNEETLKRLNSMVAILQDKFVDGKVFDYEKKELVGISKEELQQLPLEVLSGAISFLSPQSRVNS